jgi:UDP-GlcNAc:undecaprenyl-phosphate GlcNAc-1-phosphate transferase
VTFAVTPLVIRLSWWTRAAIDRPDARKNHPMPVPRLGGVAVLAGFVAGVMFCLQLSGYEGSLFSGLRIHWIGWVGAIAILFLFGVWDDLRSLPPSFKFLIQTIAALIAFSAGFRIDFLDLPIAGSIVLVYPLSLILTLLWIVGVTNAINLIDGLDGLAVGTGFVVTSTVALVALSTGVFPATVICVALAGSLLGFLPYNFNPARIFLGDSGSQFLGFTLAIVSIRGLSKSAAFVALFAPILALGLPILDTLLVMARRTWLIQQSAGEPGATRGAGSPSLLLRLRGLFLADREHIHHNLLELGLSHRSAVIVLYLASAMFCAAAFALVAMRNPSIAILVALCVASATAGIKLLALRRRRYASPRILTTLSAPEVPDPSPAGALAPAVAGGAPDGPVPARMGTTKGGSR